MRRPTRVTCVFSTGSCDTLPLLSTSRYALRPICTSVPSGRRMSWLRPVRGTVSHAVDDGLRAAAGVAAQDASAQQPGHGLPGRRDEPITIHVEVQDDPARLRHRNGGKVGARLPLAGVTDVARQPLQRDARRLLALHARGTEGVDALTMLEGAEPGGPAQ